MWALEYFTTPSSPCSTGPSPSTAMIECTLTDGTTAISCRPWIKGFAETCCRRPWAKWACGCIGIPRHVGGEASNRIRQAHQPTNEVCDPWASGHEAPPARRHILVMSALTHHDAADGRGIVASR